MTPPANQPGNWDLFPSVSLFRFIRMLRNRIQERRVLAIGARMPVRTHRDIAKLRAVRAELARRPLL